MNTYSTSTGLKLDFGFSRNSRGYCFNLFIYFFLLKRVESFLHKDVNFVVTGNKEGLDEKSIVSKGGTSQLAQQLIKQRDNGLINDKQRPGTPRPMVL